MKECAPEFYGWIRSGSASGERPSTCDPQPGRGIPLDNDRYLLKLYVTGKTARTERAVSNLQTLCDEVLADSYEIEIIDILEHPKLAEDERILATPTLIKQLPPPLRRVIGDLSDRDKVLLGLDLRSKEDSEE